MARLHQNNLWVCAIQYVGVHVILDSTPLRVRRHIWRQAINSLEAISGLRCNCNCNGHCDSRRGLRTNDKICQQIHFLERHEQRCMKISQITSDFTVFCFRSFFSSLPWVVVNSVYSHLIAHWQGFARNILCYANNATAHSTQQPTHSWARKKKNV